MFTPKNEVLGAHQIHLLEFVKAKLIKLKESLGERDGEYLI